jgi:hypothetical protein
MERRLLFLMIESQFQGEVVFFQLDLMCRLGITVSLLKLSCNTPSVAMATWLIIRLWSVSLARRWPTASWWGMPGLWWLLRVLLSATSSSPSGNQSWPCDSPSLGSPLARLAAPLSSCPSVTFLWPLALLVFLPGWREECWLLWVRSAACQPSSVQALPSLSICLISSGS